MRFSISAIIRAIFTAFFFFWFFGAHAASDSSRIWHARAERELFRNPKASLIFGEKELKTIISAGDPGALVRNYEILAEASIRLFHPDQAFSYLFRAIEIASQKKMNAAEVRCLILMGRLNWILEDAGKAIYYFSEAAKLASSAGEFSMELKAKSFESFQKIQLNPPGKKADFDKISEWLDFVSVAPVDSQSYAQAANLMGNVAFLHKADADLAIKYYQLAANLSDQMGDVYMAGCYRQNLAEMYIQKGNIPAAETLLNSILKSGREINSDMLVYSSLKFLSTCAAIRMEYRKAYELQSAYEDLKSRHLNENQQLRTNDILESYMQKRKEIQEKEQENARLSAIIESEKKLRSYQFYLVVVVFSLLILSALIISNRRRLDKIKKQRKLAEEQNAELESLNEKLRQQTLGADKARETAEAALRAKADFLSVITHEIRTPIHAVLAVSHLLEDSVSTPKNRANLEILRISAENLHSLINNVLDFNKLESGKIELEPRPFSLHELLAGIQMSFLPLAEEKGIEFQFRVDQRLPHAFIGDRLRIGQILNNLISNAIKFTGKGFVHVEVEYQRFEHQDDQVRVIVRDTGIGLNDEEKEKIFGFFAQANAGISGRYGGSGLGLTITSRLLNLMGSKLDLDSQPGKGSVFSFQLNLPETDVLFLSSSGSNGLVKINFSRFRLLFVDDVEYNRILAQRFFEKWQISYDFASSGKEAIELAAMNRYDIVLMDIILPDESGFDVALKIREMSGYDLVPILAMTASDRNEVNEKLKESGMQDFLGKPFSPEDLSQMLEKWLLKTA
jgi:signal transduction histidine kinase/CheY-like chemotaxis protein